MGSELGAGPEPVGYPQARGWCLRWAWMHLTNPFYKLGVALILLSLFVLPLLRGTL